MADDDHEADVFAIPDFWKSPEWHEAAVPERTAGGFFDMDIDADCHRDPVCIPILEDGIIPQSVLEPPSHGHVAPSPSTSAADTSPEPAPPSISSDQDPWLFLEEPVPAPTLKTWESFLSEEPGTAASANPAFISEAGPEAFSQLLASGGIPSRISPGQEHVYVNLGQLANCLLSLALGRTSLLFCWDHDKGSFRQTTTQAVVSGYSIETLQSVTAVFMGCGNDCRFLRDFVEKTYAAHATPCRVALANAVDRLLCAVQSRLGASGQSVRSLIQLQALVSPLRSTVSYFRSLIVELSTVTTDEAILSLLFHTAHWAEYETAFLHAALRDVLEIVSRPWFEFVEEWLGLRPENGIPMSKDGQGKGFVRVGKQLYSDGLHVELEEHDFFLQDDKLPSFVPDDIIRPLFETGRNIRFIRSHHPDHPLSRPQTITSSQPPTLQWQFKWDAITRIEQQARDYEQSLLELIHRAGSTDAEVALCDEQDGLVGQRGSSFEFNPFGKAEEQIQERILASIAELNMPVVQPGGVQDRLDLTLIERLAAGIDGADPHALPALTPHWSLLPLLSFGPIILAQARLVNRECTRLLFDAHCLREHLGIQLDFQLLANGLFCSRLSHALFDPDLATAERERGVALSGSSMGIRLLGRESWPPASSELRLALMGVLTESWKQRPSQDHKSEEAEQQSQDSLPGDLSFAVRELSAEEMERCMDRDSLEALDFLRLSYKPPPPLMPILTPMILSRYDRVFRHLLRVLRLLFVADQLFRAAISQPANEPASAASRDYAMQQRFRFEARHFISGISTYFFHTGIAVPWRRFEAWLDRVQAAVGASRTSVSHAGSADCGGGEDHSPEQIRQRHDDMLDEVMQALLLRKRQEPVLKLLEEIFSLVLRFAQVTGCASRGHGQATELDNGLTATVRPLYADFRGKVEVFLTVCRGLAEKGASGQRASDSSPHENPLHGLLLALDMSGFYTGPT